MAANKNVLHQKMDENISLSIFEGSERIGEIGMGTDPKAARKNAARIINAIRGGDGEITDETVG